MEWVEDKQLADRILVDLGNEIWMEKPLPHVTELIYCLTASWYQRFKPLPFTAREVCLFVVGVGLEGVLLKDFKQQISGTFDGIGFAADFLDYDGGLGEMKSTRISASKFLERIPMKWLRQVMAYLKTQGKTEITLAVMHLMGDYKPPFPELRVWKGKFTQEEIDTNWEWLLIRKETYLGYVEKGEAPKQFTYNEDWECNPCRYKLICDANQAVDDSRSSPGGS